ncbi:uncharacterized protein CEXT_801 [Caerostris extrusa]|uniref:Uncharacterized protein n=1 Tax=Caerostris extrusa TaxID=172846 RepID=A0AAV4WAZ0_CAEEX|nr:uncharacterized protein CEXT_801 [Caerostris extrusa]
MLFGACDESASQRTGPHSQVLKTLHIFDAFRDFTDHINCFYAVASTMSKLGEVVRPVNQFSYEINGIDNMDDMLLTSALPMDDKMDQHASEYSHIHDIDKLDPVMLVGYSERFEDNIVTSLWDLCVERHVRMNPHHQGHNLWHDLEEDELSRDIRADALREMVCDKVSRRVQKNLNGVMSKDMWDVEIIYYKGLPEDWMENADRIMTLMKQRGMSTVVI